MVPKKAKEVIAETAAQLNLPEELVDDVINHYYKKIRTSLSGLEEASILVHNLGTFKVKRKRLLEAKEKYEKKLEAMPIADTFMRFTLRKEAADRIDKLNNLLKVLDEEDLRKQEIKQKRHELNNKSMEESQVDPARVHQQDLQEGACGTDLLEEDEDM